MTKALAHELFGNGNHKVMVTNDYGQDTSSNDPIRPYLDTAAFTFAFMDLRGYGPSKRIDGDFTSSEATGDIVELADSLGWSQFSIVGHSMSGMVAQRLMSDHSKRLVSAVAPTPVPATSLRVDERALSFFQRIADDDDAFRRTIAAQTGDRYGKEWVDYKLAMNRANVSPTAMKAYCRMWGQEDFSEQVNGLETPLLVIYGKYDSDALNKSATLQQFEDWYPNLEVCELRCGHYPMQEVPVEYAHVVQRFLAKNSQ